MAQIKKLYLELKEIINDLLEHDYDIEDLDEVIKDILDHTSNDPKSAYQFYLDNKNSLMEISQNDYSQNYEPLNDLKNNFSHLKNMKNVSEEDVEDLLDTLQDRHPEFDEDILRHYAYRWLGLDYDDSDDSYMMESLVSGGYDNKDRFIDLRGPSGNAYVILGMARNLCKQLEKINPEDYNWEKIRKEMTSSDYKNLVYKFEEYFGDYVTIYNADVLNDGLKDENDDEDQDIDESLNKKFINEGADWIRLNSGNVYIDSWDGFFIKSNKNGLADLYQSQITKDDPEYEDIYNSLSVEDQEIVNNINSQNESLQEGCNCGKRRPRPIVKKATPLSRIFTKKKLHESNENDYIMKSLY